MSSKRGGRRGRDSIVDEVSADKRKRVIYALRQGVVPKDGLELLAVGLGRFEAAMDEELTHAAASGAFKAVRGEYGSGKTFFSSWLLHRARQQGFATSVVQVSQHTPLYRMETVYRQALENLSTREHQSGAFKQLLDSWFANLRQRCIAEESIDPDDTNALKEAVAERLQRALTEVSREQPDFAIALRALYEANADGDATTSDNLLTWLMAKGTTGAKAKRQANLSGEIESRTAWGFVRGLVALLAQTDHKGLVLVLDEVETLMRVQANYRRDSYEALRKLIDEIQQGRYPGLMVLMTGTPAFFNNLKHELPALHQRIDTQFDSVDARFDNPRAIQVRLMPFDFERLVATGQRIREVFVSNHRERIRKRVSDAFLHTLAERIAGDLGGRVGLAPRVYLKALVDVLDRVDQFEDFDPAAHYRIDIGRIALTSSEREAAGLTRSPDDVGNPNRELEVARPKRANTERRRESRGAQRRRKRANSVRTRQGSQSIITPKRTPKPKPERNGVRVPKVSCVDDIKLELSL